MPEAAVLGLDGGGSKTLVAMATRDARVVHWACGGGSNPGDQPAWRETLTGLLTGLQPQPLAAAAGLAGYGEIADCSGRLQDALAPLLDCPRSLHNDVQVAFDGAFLDRPGVLILAGTGSMAWAQDAAGRVVRVGGWGPAFGDEGSGFWVGQRAVTLTTQVLDGRLAAPGFAAAVLAAMGLAEDAPPAALLRWWSSRAHLRSAVAALARCVGTLAEHGDAVAQALLREAAAHLAAHVAAARRQIGGDGAWSHAGGLFGNGFLQRTMAGLLGPPAAPLLPPIGGALWRAARLAGWPADAGWASQLADGLRSVETGSVS